MANNPVRKERLLQLHPVPEEDLAAARAYVTRNAPDLLPALFDEEAQQ